MRILKEKLYSFLQPITYTKIGDEMKNSIEVHNLWKAYNGKNVVKGISFVVPKGEIFAFLGPNGAGKSTTISILSTLTSFDKGSIKMEGHNVGVEDIEIHKKLGIVFQDSMLDDILTVKENLRIRCGLYNLTTAQAIQRVNELISLCNLESFANQKVKTLSGGQRRSADIARALIPTPSILILDEPSTGLDPIARANLWQTIKQLHIDANLTIFMTTHYMEEAEIADQICILNKGEIIMNENVKTFKHMYGNDKLKLYGPLKKLASILASQHIAYKEKLNYIQITPMNTFQTMSILRKCEVYIEHFELLPEKIEDVYLEMIKEES